MTAKTKTERWKRLLSHGYFAPELPPCFVSNDLARYRNSIYKHILALPNVKDKPAFQKFISETSHFYFPRFAKEDRRHGTPNPVSYLLLSKIVSDNYVNLRKIAKNSKISTSPPIFDWTGSRAIARSSVDIRDKFRIELSARREHYASADIRSFFHSIYTHSIPWAIHGKKWAKSNRKVSHYGNMIDLLCRNGQDGQTIGLPVGPDTSRLLAEVIASAIDASLRTKLGLQPRDASRYVDDYTLSDSKFTSGEALIAALRESASDFELELNNDKSEINSTSSRHSNGWKQKVTKILPKGAASSSDIALYFFEAGQLCDTLPHINVEKFALQNARNSLMNATDWKSVQNLLINVYRRNSSTISLLVEILILRNVEKADLDLPSLSEFITHRIPFLAKSNRTGEIIWLLFLAIRLNLTIDSSNISCLSSINNGFIATLSAIAINQKIFDKRRIDFTDWNQFLNSDGLRSHMWLYAYEATSIGVIPNMRNTSFIAKDNYFSLFDKHKIRFIDISKGFTSFRATMNSLRSANNRVSFIQHEFDGNLEIDIDDFDESNDIVSLYDSDY